jgi:hypothetical protein
MKTGLNQEKRTPDPWGTGMRTVAMVGGSGTSKGASADGDWELAVRSTFFGECLQQGVGAELTREALARVVDPENERKLREQAEAFSRRAALGWLRLETLLATYGELAAFALARCLEEAMLDIRRRAAPRRPPSLPGGASPAGRPSQVVLKEGDPHALAIVQRARERLARLWDSNGFCAA